MLGCGTVREYIELSVKNAWSRFGLSDGANTIDEMLQRLNSFSSNTSQVTSLTSLRNTILGDVLWLDEAIEMKASLWIIIRIRPTYLRKSANIILPYSNTSLSE